MNNNEDTIEINFGKKYKEKCSCCKKKSLFLIKCKCGNSFCLKHKYPESHSCTFDFKHEITKENLVDCNFKKIEKI